MSTVNKWKLRTLNKANFKCTLGVWVYSYLSLLTTNDINCSYVYKINISFLS